MTLYCASCGRTDGTHPPRIMPDGDGVNSNACAGTPPGHPWLTGNYLHDCKLTYPVKRGFGSMFGVLPKGTALPLLGFLVAGVALMWAVTNGATNHPFTLTLSGSAAAGFLTYLVIGLFPDDP